MAKKKKNGKMSRKIFEAELQKLQTELCIMQEWVKQEGLKIIVVFEGRDAAGKGGVLKRITERVSPRVFRLVALPAPSDREKSQLYMQRYMAHFPVGGIEHPHIRRGVIPPQSPKLDKRKKTPTGNAGKGQLPARGAAGVLG